MKYYVVMFVSDGRDIDSTFWPRGETSFIFKDDPRRPLLWASIERVREGWLVTKSHPWYGCYHILSWDDETDEVEYEEHMK